MNFEEITNKIQEKLGKDNAGLIADDIANLISYESTMNKNIKSQNEEITKLKKDKEMLIEANGNLLQQISSESEDILKNEGKEEPKAINVSASIKSAFDKFGNFIN